MKGIVVYYSATGSTKKIARAIHRGMKELIEDCEVAPISKVDPSDMDKYNLIGIGGPIWGYRESANLRLFVYNMPVMDGKLCFPFCTHGSTPSGFMISLGWALERKGLKIIGYKDWYGSMYNVIAMPKPYFNDGHPDEIDLEEAEGFGREMAECARRIAVGETSLIPELPKGPDADPLWRLIRLGHARPEPGRELRTQTQRSINMDKCTYPGCTLCVDNCIVDTIDFSQNPPVFKAGCIDCSLCNRLCPVGAIELDAESTKRRSQKTINMDKCTFPQCTLGVDHCPMHSIDFSAEPPAFKWSCEGCNLCWTICPRGAIEIASTSAGHEIAGVGMNRAHPFLKVLAEAEVKGRFRRLVPLDQIGWDNRIRNIEKHPRFSVEELDID